MRIAVEYFRAFTARDFVTLLGRTRPDANAVDSEWRSRIIGLSREKGKRRFKRGKSHDGEFDVEGKKTSEVETAESVGRKPPTEQALP